MLHFYISFEDNCFAHISRFFAVLRGQLRLTTVNRWSKLLNQLRLWNLNHVRTAWDMLYDKETFYTIVSPPAALEIIYFDYLCNVFECIICKMSQKDQPSINYPVCVIDETDELRTDFKIGTFLTKQTRFLLILGKSSLRLYNRSTMIARVYLVVTWGCKRALFEIVKVKSRLLKRLIWSICIQYQKWRKTNFYKVKLFEIFTFK